jgi:hypothetical protein
VRRASSIFLGRQRPSRRLCGPFGVLFNRGVRCVIEGSHARLRHTRRIVLSAQMPGPVLLLRGSLYAASVRPAVQLESKASVSALRQPEPLTQSFSPVSLRNISSPYRTLRFRRATSSKQCNFAASATMSRCKRMTLRSVGDARVSIGCRGWFRGWSIAQSFGVDGDCGIRNGGQGAVRGS